MLFQFVKLQICSSLKFISSFNSNLVSYYEHAG